MLDSPMENFTTETKNTARQNNSAPGPHPIIHSLLKKRGMDEEDMKEFFSNDIGHIPDLIHLKDMDKASDRIIHAIKNNEKIAIYGDYDVDGTTASALLHHFFRIFGIKVPVIQPDRFVDGYGLHKSKLKEASEQGIDVFITVDCGITNIEEAKYANELGIDLIVTDHHKDATEEFSPAFAVINPNRRDEDTDSELTSLSGAGVAFFLCISIRKKWGSPLPSLYSLLPLVAIGTICDLVPLKSTNLKLSRHGLMAMKTSEMPGIKCFLTPEERQYPIVDSDKLSFFIGPLINSKGRLDHPEMALKLLTCETIEEAYHLKGLLEDCNNERKRIQNNVFKEAKKQIVTEIDETDLLATLPYQKDWHEGVVGIVASKMVETFMCPSIVFTDSNEKGVIKASARTAGEFNIFEALKSFEHYFIKFGGHFAAAGLSMKKENYLPFKKDFKNYLKEVPYSIRVNSDTFDYEIELEEITPTLAKNLEILGPFSTHNTRPIFKSKNFTIKSFDILKEAHVRWSFSGKKPGAPVIKGISFNYVDKWGVLGPEEIFQGQNQSPLTMYFTIGINRFRGNEYLQLLVKKITIDDV
jgi:single-stranded-DNA-specific exonuclease